VAKPKVVPISCLMRPSDAWKPHLKVLVRDKGVVSLERVLHATDAVDKLAQVIEQSIEASTTSDGRCDMRDVATKVLAVIVQNQKDVLVK
jgi:hypothetical protein